MNDTELSQWLADSKAGFLAELLEAGRPAERAKGLYDIEVEPKQRGRGLGRLALELAETPRAVSVQPARTERLGANHPARSL